MFSFMCVEAVLSTLEGVVAPALEMGARFFRAKRRSKAKSKLGYAHVNVVCSDEEYEQMMDDPDMRQAAYDGAQAQRLGLHRFPGDRQINLVFEKKQGKRIVKNKTLRKALKRRCKLDERMSAIEDLEVM